MAQAMTERAKICRQRRHLSKASLSEGGVISKVDDGGIPKEFVAESDTIFILEDREAMSVLKKWKVESEMKELPAAANSFSQNNHLSMIVLPAPSMREPVESSSDLLLLCAEFYFNKKQLYSFAALIKIVGVADNKISFPLRGKWHLRSK